FQERIRVAAGAEMVLPPGIGRERGGAGAETLNGRERREHVRSEQRHLAPSQQGRLRIGKERRRVLVMTGRLVDSPERLRRAAGEEMRVERDRAGWIRDQRRLQFGGGFLVALA